MAAGLTGLMLGSLAVGAQAERVGDPSDHLGENAVHCGDLDQANPAEGTSGTTLVIDGDGTYTVTDGDDTVFEIVVTNWDGTSFDVSVSAGILLHVVVKGGPNYRVYTYSGVPNETDSGLQSPDHPSEGHVPGISHAFVCYGVEQTTTTSEDPTTTTEEETTSTTEEETTTTTEAVTTTTEEETTTTTEQARATTTTEAVSETTVAETPTTVLEVEGTVFEQSTPTTAAAKVLGEQLARTGAFSDVLTALSGFALLLGGLTLAVSAVPARSRLDA